MRWCGRGRPLPSLPLRAFLRAGTRRSLPCAVVRALVLALLALGLVGLTGLAVSRYGHATTPLGLRLDGEVVPPTADVAGVARSRAERWGEAEVVIVFGPLTEVRTLRELGASLDVEAITSALAALRDARGAAAIASDWRAYGGELEIRSPSTLDEERLHDVIDELSMRVGRAPRAAVLGTDGRVREPAERGRELDAESAFVALREALLRGERRATLPVRELLPDALPFVATIPLATIGAYHTRYRARGDEGPRAINVRLAAELLDGAVIAPYGRLSFNDRVGPRTLDRGFRVAHVIERGELVDGIGGGVCQVASTLHAAAFVAGLPIVEARPHTRPLPYIPMGLDATVAYPVLDLVIGNPLGVPITVRAHAEGGSLDVELIARATPAEVRWERDVLERIDHDERIDLDPSLPLGTDVVVEDGGPGFELVRTRTIRDTHGERSERVHLRYPPTTRIVRRGGVPTEPLPTPMLDPEA